MKMEADAIRQICCCAISFAWIEQFVEAVVERGTCGLPLDANELHVDVNRKIPQPVLGYEWRHRRRKCWLRTQRTSSNARLPPVNCHMN